MCVHKFVFPEDKPENYNPDGKTITGGCQCGATQEAYGLRPILLLQDNFVKAQPFCEAKWGFDSSIFLDKWNDIW